MRVLLRFTVFVVLVAALALPAAAKETLYSVGVARVDITPDYPVRLAGYAVRKTECDSVAQHIWAKALAIGTDRQHPTILITVDNCGVPIGVRNDVTAELRRLRKVDPDNVAICSTHTHSAPLLDGYLTQLFLGPLPADQQARLSRYTKELTQSLVKVACQALDDRQPARLTHDKGQATFAGNRRIKGGPVNHDVPMLFVRSPEGAVRAVFANYACHCTTLTGEFNQICGDWAGYAQAQIEREHPGTVCLIALGCGADSNPDPRPGFELAISHGAQIAKAVGEVFNHAGAPVSGKLSVRTRHIELPYDTLPTRAEWEARAKTGGYPAQHARVNLERLDRGEKLPTSLPYMVQTWSFGDSLLMVFLPGEVTVEYSLRLNKEMDPSRIWVNGYSNDMPCYIPSEAVLKRGEYEASDSMIYYDRPTRFATGVEDLIINTVHKISPNVFNATTTK